MNQFACYYTDNNADMLGITVFVPSPMKSADRWAGMKANITKMAGAEAPVAVTGVGEDAMYVPSMGTLFFKKEEEIYTVNMMMYDKDGIDKKSVASKVGAAMLQGK